MDRFGVFGNYGDSILHLENGVAAYSHSWVRCKNIGLGKTEMNRAEFLLKRYVSYCL